MIDEKRVLEEIADFKRCQKSENCDYLTGYISALSAVEGMIAEQPKAGEWIPCGERLPEEEDTYLVAWLPAYEDGNGDCFTHPCPYPHYYMLATYTEDEEWEFTLPSGYKEAVLLAWMPLPLYYRG
jgi:hypothetical protein